MAKVKHAYKKLGKPPGFLVYTGDNPVDKLSVDFYAISNCNLTQKLKCSFSEIAPLIKDKDIVWLNVNGLADVDGVAEIGSYLGIHPLTLEDVVNVGSRSKFEEFDDYVFMTLKMIHYDNKYLNVEHVCFILKDNIVISFQEIEEDVFGEVRSRLIEGKGLMQQYKADYLYYALIDALVDYYFVVMETMGDNIDELENRILTNPQEKDIEYIQRLKRDIFKIRKAAAPMRESISKFEKTTHPLILAKTKPYIRDVYDHSYQLMDSIDTYRELISSLIDFYMGQMSNRMNNVMKTLTIISTIFIPLTFLVGVYGMNFKNMPELNWPNGYYGLWLIMLLIALLLGIYFKRKKWL